MKNIIKICLSAVMILVLTVSAVACTAAPTGKAAYDPTKTGKGEDVKMTEVRKEIDSMKVEEFVASEQQSDYVLIDVKDYGKIVVVLRRDIAPKTVANFKKLVAEDFYTGTVFHRVMEDFMVQAGGFEPKDGKHVQKKADTIKGEFTFNGFTNNLTHVRGVLAMARVGGMNDSASSQFYIVHETNYSTMSLNYDYATFGYVLAGMDVVDAIATCKVDNTNPDSPKPVVDIIINSVSFVEPK